MLLDDLCNTLHARTILPILAHVGQQTAIEYSEDIRPTYQNGNSLDCD